MNTPMMNTLHELRLIAESPAMMLIVLALVVR